MNQPPLDIGLCGVGRVYERLYAPALGRVPGLRVAAVADPSADRRALAGPGVRGYESVEAMLAEGGLDGAIVLSPPRLHHEHTMATLAAGVPVLVEKPPAASTAELREWAAVAGGQPVSVSLSRRYWRRYRALKARLRGDEHLELVLRTRPGGWGAVDPRPEDPALDLLPHLVDLARWLTSSAAVAVHSGEGRDEGCVGVELADGRTIDCVAGHGAAYEEYVVADGRRVPIGPPSAVESALRRVRRAPDEDVRGFVEMLIRWEERLRGGSGRGLAGFRDAWATVAALEAYAKLGPAGGRAELAKAPGG